MTMDLVDLYLAKMAFLTMVVFVKSVKSIVQLALITQVSVKLAIRVLTLTLKQTSVNALLVLTMLDQSALHVNVVSSLTVNSAKPVQIIVMNVQNLQVFALLAQTLMSTITQQTLVCALLATLKQLLAVKLQSSALPANSLIEKTHARAVLRLVAVPVQMAREHAQPVLSQQSP